MSRHAFVGLGYISGVYGVRGWVKVYSFTDPRDQILRYSQWHLGPSGTPDAPEPAADSAHIAVETGRVQGKGIVAKLAGCEDRDAAAALIGAAIFVSREALPQAEPGTYYWADLQGLRVCNTQGTVLGHVDHLLETGVHDVLVLDGGSDRLIPFVLGRTVLDVDLEGGEIRVDWDPDWWE